LNNKASEEQLIVAIWMITFNHESYIAQAVESVMVQKANFKYKLFIGEDFSTDKTREICLGLKRKYPDKIELLLQNKNTGGYKNSHDLYKRCYESDAKYIALCDGDDYWTDPLKLQRQVSFMDANMDYNICAHQTDVLTNERLEKKEWRWDSNRTTFTCVDYLYALFFHTSSIMFRHDKSFMFIPDISILQGDIFLCLSVVKDKRIFIIDESMSVYRRHKKGLTNSLKHKSYDEKYKSWMVLLEKFNIQTNNKYRISVWLKRKTLFFANERNNQVCGRKYNYRGYICYFLYKGLFQFQVRLKAKVTRSAPILID
jgi:glycosyltransferase involved in cell wall biosynthesis